MCTLVYYVSISNLDKYESVFGEAYGLALLSKFSITCSEDKSIYFRFMCNRAYASRSSSWDDIEILEVIDPMAHPPRFRCNENKQALFDLLLSARCVNVAANVNVCQEVKKVLKLRDWTDTDVYMLLFVCAGKTNH